MARAPAAAGASLASLRRQSDGQSGGGGKPQVEQLWWQAACRMVGRSNSGRAGRAERQWPKHASNSRAAGAGEARERGGEEARERAEKGGGRRGGGEAGRVVGVIPPSPRRRRLSHSRRSTTSPTILVAATTTSGPTTTAVPCYSSPTPARWDLAGGSGRGRVRPPRLSASLRPSRSSSFGERSAA